LGCRFSWKSGVLLNRQGRFSDKGSAARLGGWVRKFDGSLIESENGPFNV
jgi:hypothetical protein